MRRMTYAGRLVREFWSFARRNKMYWILPLVLVLGLMIFLILAGETTLPFIYTLF